MFRNDYDGDNTTWSPRGRLHQVEYATEAVKQGSCTVGLRSSTHAVVVVLKRSPSELASFQKKIIMIDGHAGVGFSGLTSDARVLSNFMRSECMASRMVYGREMPISRLAMQVSNKAQLNTQRYGRRPYGVGLLLVGFDETGPHLIECSPTGNFNDYYAVSIGARSQSAKTYLERNFERFAALDLDSLIAEGIKAIAATLQGDKTVTKENLAIGYVGVDCKFTCLEDEDVLKYLPSSDAMDTS